MHTCYAPWSVFRDVTNGSQQQPPQPPLLGTRTRKSLVNLSFLICGLLPSSSRVCPHHPSEPLRTAHTLACGSASFLKDQGQVKPRPVAQAPNANALKLLRLAHTRANANAVTVTVSQNSSRLGTITLLDARAKTVSRRPCAVRICNQKLWRARPKRHGKVKRGEAIHRINEAEATGQQLPCETQRNGKRATTTPRKSLSCNAPTLAQIQSRVQTRPSPRRRTMPALLETKRRCCKKPRRDPTFQSLPLERLFAHGPWTLHFSRSQPLNLASTSGDAPNTRWPSPQHVPISARVCIQCVSETRAGGSHLPTRSNAAYRKPHLYATATVSLSLSLRRVTPVPVQNPDCRRSTLDHPQSGRHAHLLRFCAYCP